MSSVAVLGAYNVAKMALKNKGLLSAWASRVGNMGNPTFLVLLCFHKQIARHLLF